MYSEFQTGIDSTFFPPHLVEEGACRKKDLGVGGGDARGRMGEGKGTGTVRRGARACEGLSFQLELCHSFLLHA